MAPMTWKIWIQDQANLGALRAPGAAFQYLFHDTKDRCCRHGKALLRMLYQPSVGLACMLGDFGVFLSRAEGLAAHTCTEQVFSTRRGFKVRSFPALFTSPSMQEYTRVCAYTNMSSLCTPLLCTGLIWCRGNKNPYSYFHCHCYRNNKDNDDDYYS